MANSAVSGLSEAQVRALSAVPGLNITQMQAIDRILREDQALRQSIPEAQGGSVQGGVLQGGVLQGGTAVRKGGPRRKYHTEEERKEAMKASRAKYLAKPFIAEVEALKEQIQSQNQNSVEVAELRRQVRELSEQCRMYAIQIKALAKAVDNHKDVLEEITNHINGEETQQSAGVSVPMSRLQMRCRQ